MKTTTTPKIYLFLVEVIIAMLILALSSIVILKVFVKANQISEKASETTMAMLKSESLAEAIKSGETKIRQVNIINHTMYYDKKWKQTNDKGAYFMIEIVQKKTQRQAGSLVSYEIITKKQLGRNKEELYHLAFKKYNHKST